MYSRSIQLSDSDGLYAIIVVDSDKNELKIYPEDCDITISIISVPFRDDDDPTIQCGELLILITTEFLSRNANIYSLACCGNHPVEMTIHMRQSKSQYKFSLIANGWGEEFNAIWRLMGRGERDGK